MSDESTEKTPTRTRRKSSKSLASHEEAPEHAGLDLRGLAIDERLTADSKRFDIFLIDTGWNRPVSKAVHRQLPLIYEFQAQDSLYILTREQSVEVGKRNPEYIGLDPTILVYDRYASSQAGSDRYKGFRLNLGLLRNPEQALSRLQEFVRFIAQHRVAENLDREVRRQMHREGFEGIIKIVREGFEAGIELI